MSMYEVIGKNQPDYLLADPEGADIIAIPCEPGNGTVNRGTVVYRKSSGMYAPATAADVVATNLLAVLNETVDTEADTSVAEDAAAYRAGRMIYGRVFLKGDAKLSVAEIAVLRGEGIVFDQMDTADEFNNKKELK